MAPHPAAAASLASASDPPADPADPPDPPDPPPPDPPPWWKRWGGWIAATALLVALLAVVYAKGPLVDVVPSAIGPWRLAYAFGRTRVIEVQPEYGTFSWPYAERLVYRHIADIDADGHREALVVSVDGTHPKGSTGIVRVHCFADDGSLKWRYAIADTLHCGDTTYEGTVWSVEGILFHDWDADGTVECIVACSHTMFVSLLAIIGPDGELKRRYVNAGHIKGVVAVPNEAYEIWRREPVITGLVPPARGQGPALVLSVEFNEPPRGAGLVILPPGFESGSYPARQSHFRCDELEPLEDAVYVRLMPSSLARSFPQNKNWPENLEWQPHDSQPRIRVSTLETPDGQAVMRYFDEHLRQNRVVLTDRIQHAYPQVQQFFAADSIAYRVSGSWRFIRSP